jgi:alcohol dehydrogenase
MIGFSQILRLGSDRMAGYYLMPPVNLMGRGSLQKTGSWMEKLGGRKALIVASIGEYGELQGSMVLEVLKAHGLEGDVFPGAGPNPTDEMVEEAVGRYFGQRCDCLIAVGGGSAMDCTKAASVSIGRIDEKSGKEKGRKDRPPFIAINTTAGTGSEATSFAVITDSENHRKITVQDWTLMPDVSINDPDLMLSMPPGLTAATGMDALSHAVEAYVSTEASLFSDGIALQAIRTIFRWLPMAVRYGDSIEAREAMCNAAFMAGVAFNNAGLGYVHALSHPISAMYGAPHGLVNAILLPVVERYNLPAAATKMATMGSVIDEATYDRYGIDHSGFRTAEKAEKVVEAMADLAKEIGITGGLSSLGVTENSIDDLALAASKEAIGINNPRKGVLQEIKELYIQAL